MTATPRTETHFQGLPISGGVVLARTCLFRQGPHEVVPDYQVSGDGIERERQRLRQAVAAVAEHLKGLEQAVHDRLTQAEAGILAVQRTILEDPTLDAQFMAAIDAGRNAESAVHRTIEQYQTRLREVGDSYYRERAGDLGELKRRLLDGLAGTKPALECADEPQCQRGRKRIVVTEELTPALALDLDADQVRGIVTARGGPTSHAAILARALGIPAVSGIENIHDLVACGTEVLVNGDTGEVIVWPTPETVARFDLRRSAAARVRVENPVEGLCVLANIGLAADVAVARAMKAEGIGLYRTELEFFSAGRLLTEDEQAARYAEVLEAVAGQPVCFRLLDLGGDKPSPIFDFPPEQNPSLGLRGLRFLLSRPELLRTQARALARASRHGPVRVMYPMVIGLDQFRLARRLFEEATADVEKGEVLHGPMFEVPSALFEARALLAEADFASIGSNDLLQYLFAVDRNNEHVAADYYPDRETFWRVLEDLVRASREADRPLALCGELASDPQYIPKLLSLGIRTVSVSARLISGVRRAARKALAGRRPT